MTRKELGRLINEKFFVLVEFTNERGLISERPYLKEDAAEEERFLLHESADPNLVVYEFEAVLAINGSIQRGNFITQFEK
jgi:hypothetical protein